MTNKLLWTPESGVTLLSTELNNLAHDAIAVGSSEYINATNLYRWASFLFFADAFDGAPDAGSVAELHIFYQLDGTNYADGEAGDAASPAVSGASRHGVFPIASDDALDQYQQILRVPLEPFDFKAAIKLRVGAGNDLTAVDTHFVKMYPYNENLQDTP